MQILHFSVGLLLAKTDESIYVLTIAPHRLRAASCPCLLITSDATPSDCARRKPSTLSVNLNQPAQRVAHDAFPVLLELRQPPSVAIA